MSRTQCVLICTLILCSFVSTVVAKKSFGFGGRHSYPKSPGLSGGGGHSSHSYPSSPGLSGHGHQSSGGSHGYPGSHGMSGSSSGAKYPTNTHHSNSHGYPPTSGLSGNSHPNSPKHVTINNNYNYHYNPPQHISYTPVHGGAPMNYPVYHGPPPTYVYQYKDSGSKYSNLLAGLALFNLGALAGAAVGHSTSHSSSNTYHARPGEVCKFGIKKDNGDYEETRIDCQLISSFIFQEEAKSNNPNSPTNTTVTTTTVTNVTMTNITNVMPESAPVNGQPDAPNFTVLANGTLVPVNANETAANTTMNSSEMNKTESAPTASAANNSMTSSVVVTTTTTNTTVTNAVDVKGPPVQVTPGMKCYVIRLSPTNNMRKTVPCGLLQAYAEKSLRKNSANRNVPMLTLFAVVITAFVIY